MAAAADHEAHTAAGHASGLDHVPGETLVAAADGTPSVAAAATFAKPTSTVALPGLHPSHSATASLRRGGRRERTGEREASETVGHG